MSRLRTCHLGAATLALALSLVPVSARADLWRDVTEQALGEATGGWTNKTDVADVDGDGDVDLLFANGSAYNEPDEPQLNGVWLNEGNDSEGVPKFTDVSAEVLGDEGDFTRVIKGRDVNGDGIVDLIVGNTYETQSRLYLGEGGGKFTERTDLLPKMNASVGDLEVGDVDGDGDLDIVLADWGLDGPGGELLDPFTAEGARPLVWINRLDERAGKFTDESDRVRGMPTAWAWEMELIDVDGDFDLDIMASSKVGEGSTLYVNDGEGSFESADQLPHFTNNYDFEPIFVQLPGSQTTSLAVLTINDGAPKSNQFDRPEHIFVADADGRFEDATEELWPDDQNKGEDDNMVVVLDFDSDGDPDFLIGALGDGEDRLHVNELSSEGRFTLDENLNLSTGLSGTPGTLGIALADLNGDAKLDVVVSQGELAEPEHVYLGDDIAPDTAAPIVAAQLELDGAVLARVHDNKSPSRAHDWKSVAVVTADEAIEMTWVGEFYWRAELDGLKEGTEYRVCATDAAGNEACGDTAEVGGAGEDAKEDAVDVADDDGGSEAAGCRIGGGAPQGLALFGLLVLGAVRRRR